MIMMQFVDMFWLIQPVYDHLYTHSGGATFHILDISCLVGIGSVFFGCFFLFLTKNALVPVKDPRLAESLNFENYPSDPAGAEHG